MPVDADPVAVPRGFRLEEQDEGSPPLARWTASPDSGERLYESHFATCPFSEHHRKVR